MYVHGTESKKKGHPFFANKCCKMILYIELSFKILNYRLKIFKI